MKARRHPETPSALEVALLEAILATEGDALDRAALIETAIFVQRQLDALPARLSIPYRAGIALFFTQVLLRHRRPFSALDLDRRRAAVEAWAYGPVPVLRQLFRPLRSVALLARYDR